MKWGYWPPRFRRLAAERGYNRALVATEHAMIIGVWHMLTTGEFYRDHNARLAPARVIRRKIADLEAAG